MPAIAGKSGILSGLTLSSFCCFINQLVERGFDAPDFRCDKRLAFFAMLKNTKLAVKINFFFNIPNKILEENVLKYSILI